MKYNLTNETFLPEMIRDFPGASDMTFGDIFVASLFMNVVPLVVSTLTYYPIYLGIKTLFKRVTIFSLIITGIIMTATTPLVYLITGVTLLKYNSQIISWALCFVLSLTTYLLLNKEMVVSNNLVDIYNSGTEKRQNSKHL
jgi:hypothetical protein